MGDAVNICRKCGQNPTRAHLSSSPLRVCMSAHSASRRMVTPLPSLTFLAASMARSNTTTISWGSLNPSAILTIDPTTPSMPEAPDMSRSDQGLGFRRGVCSPPSVLSTDIQMAPSARQCLSPSKPFLRIFSSSRACGILCVSARAACSYLGGGRVQPSIDSKVQGLGGVVQGLGLGGRVQPSIDSKVSIAPLLSPPPS
jgi:hypothetical protein